MRRRCCWSRSATISSFAFVFFLSASFITFRRIFSVAACLYVILEGVNLWIFFVVIVIFLPDAIVFSNVCRLMLEDTVFFFALNSIDVLSVANRLLSYHEGLYLFQRKSQHIVENRLVIGDTSVAVAISIFLFLRKAIHFVIVIKCAPIPLISLTCLIKYITPQL